MPQTKTRHHISAEGELIWTNAKKRKKKQKKMENIQEDTKSEQE